MQIKIIVTLIILASLSAFCNSANVNYQPNSKASIERNINSDLSDNDSSLTEEDKDQLDRVKKRIVWLESLRKAVYYTKNGVKIFPYEKKIKDLKQYVNSLEKASRM